MGKTVTLLDIGEPHVSVCNITCMHCFEIGLEVDVTEKERTSVLISWSVASGSILSSEVVWRVLTSSSESGESVNQGSSGSITSTKHTIEGLQHESVYNITVTVNTAGSGSFSQYVITFTGGLEFINAGFTFTFQHSSRMRVRCNILCSIEHSTYYHGINYNIAATSYSMPEVHKQKERGL